MTTMVSTSVYAKTGVEIIDFESSFHLHVFTLAESHTVSFPNVIMLLLQNGELSPLGRQTPGESLIATEETDRQTERREDDCWVFVATTSWRNCHNPEPTNSQKGRTRIDDRREEQSRKTDRKPTLKKSWTGWQRVIRKTFALINIFQIWRLKDSSKINKGGIFSFFFISYWRRLSTSFDDRWVTQLIEIKRTQKK